MSPWLHLCCPGPAYVTLDTLLLSWIQFCRPGYTQGAGGYTFVALDTIMSPWRHICQPGYTYVALDNLMSPWIHLCHPGYTYVTLDTLMSPWIHSCRPGYTFVTLDTLMSPWIHLCCPGYTYVALVTPMSPWIHLCPPGYTYQVHKNTYVLCKYTKVSTKLMYVHVHKCTVLFAVIITLKLCELHSSAPLPPQRDVGIWYGCSHCSHSQSIEIIGKKLFTQFFLYLLLC